MTVDQYFTTQLASLRDPVMLTDDEQKMLKLGQLEEFIFRRLTSKKFRRNKITDKTVETIRSKVKLSVSQQKPIYLIFGFGGFKNVNLAQHHPHIGWGEVFNLMFITKQLMPLLQVYQSGVIFEYESENEGAVYANNYTEQDAQTYNQDFKKLIGFFKQYTPTNLEFRYVTLSEQYKTASMFADVDAKLPEAIAGLKAKPTEELEPLIKRALHNIKLNGREDLTQLNPEDLRERAIRSLAQVYTFLEEDYHHREQYFNGEERIMTIGSYCTEEENPDNWITINSTAHSANAFWTSAGILEQKEGGFDDIIIGPTKYAQLKPQLHTEETTTFADLIPGLDQVEVLTATE